MSKVPIYIRIDEETLAWFRKVAPKGYQTRMNDVLRTFKQHEWKRTYVLLGRAQEIFRQFYARCFWHLKKDWEITVESIPIIQEGLRKHGGREGFRIAAELDLNHFLEMNNAD